MWFQNRRQRAKGKNGLPPIAGSSQIAAALLGFGTDDEEEDDDEHDREAGYGPGAHSYGPMPLPAPMLAGGFACNPGAWAGSASALGSLNLLVASSLAAANAANAATHCQAAVPDSRPRQARILPWPSSAPPPSGDGKPLADRGRRSKAEKRRSVPQAASVGASCPPMPLGQGHAAPTAVSHLAHTGLLPYINPLALPGVASHLVPPVALSPVDPSLVPAQPAPPIPALSLSPLAPSPSAAATKLVPDDPLWGSMESGRTALGPRWWPERPPCNSQAARSLRALPALGVCPPTAELLGDFIRHAQGVVGPTGQMRSGETTHIPGGHADGDEEDGAPFPDGEDRGGGDGDGDDVDMDDGRWDEDEVNALLEDAGFGRVAATRGTGGGDLVSGSPAPALVASAAQQQSLERALQGILWEASQPTPPGDRAAAQASERQTVLWNHPPPDTAAEAERLRAQRPPEHESCAATFTTRTADTAADAATDAAAHTAGRQDDCSPASTHRTPAGGADKLAEVAPNAFPALRGRVGLAHRAPARSPSP